MTYKVIPTKVFIKDSKKVGKTTLDRIKKKIDEVSVNPERYKHLKHNLSNRCRIRVGKLRILFSYNMKLKELYVEKILFKHDY